MSAVCLGGVSGKRDLLADGGLGTSCWPSPSVESLIWKVNKNNNNCIVYTKNITWYTHHSKGQCSWNKGPLRSRNRIQRIQANWIQSNNSSSKNKQNHNSEGGLETQSWLALILTILFLRLLCSFSFDWEDTSNTRDSVSSAIQPSNFVKILRCASYFQLSSRCLDIPMKHCLSCLIYYSWTVKWSEVTHQYSH